MWPPSRASARVASSAFTFEPISSSPRLESFKVCTMTSALTSLPCIAIAVRQTPLMEIESPIDNSLANFVENVMTDESARFVIDEILAIS